MSSIAQTKESSADAGPASWLSQVTVEQALYGLSLCLALGLRLATQKDWPLLEGEASLALAAWHGREVYPGRPCGGCLWRDGYLGPRAG